MLGLSRKSTDGINFIEERQKRRNWLQCLMSGENYKVITGNVAFPISVVIFLETSFGPICKTKIRMEPDFEGLKLLFSKH